MYFRTRTLKELVEQKENLDQVETIKLILNNVSHQGTFLNLVHCDWIGGRRSYRLKEDAINLINAITQDAKKEIV